MPKPVSCVLLAMMSLAPADPALSQVNALPEARIEQLIAAMSVAEKVSMLRGGIPGMMPPMPAEAVGEVGYLPGVPRLGIPDLRLTDGPAGVRIGPATTALPAPVALAATFSADAARAYGRVLGREARANRQDVLFGPMVNIVRVPNAGRNFETMGEDPFLMSRLAAAQVEAIQREGVIATVKHFAANNQESERETIDVNVDARTLQEVELPGFEAAVRAGVGAVMCAYNKVNGRPACESSALLTDILRGQWGFTGFVVSDYGATHSAAPSLKAGLEMEFLSTRFAALEGEVKDGTLPMPVLDEAVRRILRTMNRFGMLADTVRPRPPMDVEGSARVARDVATQGAVLLRNAGALPLRADDLRSMVVVGPIADRVLVGGGGSSRVVGFREREKSQLAALTGRAGRDARVTYVAGIDLDGVAIPSSYLAPDGAASGTHGLLRTDETTGATQVDAQVDFTGDRALPTGSRVTWTGTLDVPTTGEYELKLHGDIGVPPFGVPLGGSLSLEVDGRVLVATTPFPFTHESLSLLLPTRDNLSSATARVMLRAGPHRLVLRAGIPVRMPMGSSPTPPRVPVRLAWVTPEMRRANIAAAVAAARDAKAVVVFAYNEGIESRDRPSLALPVGQDELIAAVVAANPRTVVVLDTGDPVTMPWANRANAILQMWYPGQEGAEATADLLLGVANPSGRLPVTFPRQERDAPTATPRRYPGVKGEQWYSEGIFVGYRWYDRQGIAPLFPFGHGLSYTTFGYSQLEVAPVGDGFDVRFTVRNTGAVRGTEVAQLYLGPPKSAPVAMAPKQLAGFARVELDPGASRRVTLHLGARELSYWAAREKGWRVARGLRPLMVGASSRDIRLRGMARVR